MGIDKIYRARDNDDKAIDARQGIETHGFLLPSLLVRVAAWLGCHPRFLSVLTCLVIGAPVVACSLGPSPFASPRAPSPFVSPPATPTATRVIPFAKTIRLPLVWGPEARPDVWRAWPRHKFGLAATTALNSDVAAQTVAALPAYGVTTWDAKLAQADRAAKYGIVYFPRLHVKAVFSDADLDGVVEEAADLARCEPAKSQEAEARKIAAKYPGMMWDLFNEPDNLDLLSGSGCFDPTTGGKGYRGFGGDPRMTGPRHAYRQAAAVARYWIETIRAVDPTARFTCCGELNGASATYVRGVADAYRELYGQPIPLAAVSLHIYLVNDYDLARAQNALRAAYAAIDGHPDLRGLSVSINEGILLAKALDATSLKRAALLLYAWMDWLALPENSRVVFMGWWVDAYCSRYSVHEVDWGYCMKQYEIVVGQDNNPGTRLFQKAPGGYGPITPVGEMWRDFACNWMDDRLQPVPLPCRIETEVRP